VHGAFRRKAWEAKVLFAYMTTDLAAAEHHIVVVE